eukprot:8259520-Pyramimonas_sp.AAC.1
MWTTPLGHLVELRMAPRSFLLGGKTHVDTATGAFGGAADGPPERCTGWVRRMWTPPLGHSVELPMGPRNPVLAGGDECGNRH